MDEEKGFTTGDRRGAGSEWAKKTGESAAKPHADRPAEPVPNQPVPPINFVSFVYSLAMSALMSLGEPVGEGAAGQGPNLPPAQENIDILTMLESKTKGNLMAEEETLLQEMLYTLRIKFVERAKARKS